MGIIQQQTIKGSFYSYLGVALGFITSTLLLPHIITPEQVGLTVILTSFSQMFAQFSILGFNGTSRYFPYFRNDKNNHNGYLFLFCAVALTGFVLFGLLAVVLKDWIISQDAQQSQLFEEYYWYLLPLTFFTLFFNVFDIYSQRLYDTISGRILNEFAKRVFILLALLLIAFNLLDFHTFIQFWLLANILPTFLLGYKLYTQKQLILRPHLTFIDGDLKKKLVNMSLFAILTGSAPLIVHNIDAFMINERYGLSDTGVYGIAFFFGSVITLPARSLYPIAYTIISESWKTSDFENIRMIYQKSCINQLIAAAFLFILLWANIDNVLAVLPAEYANGKYVIFFIGLAWVLDSATGTSGVILNTSKFFKYDSLFYLSLVAVTILGNLLLIPVYGITGAAIAFLITYAIFNLFRYLFIWRAFDMQPFSVKNLLILVLSILIYLVGSFIPDVSAHHTTDSQFQIILISILNIGIRSAVISSLFILSIYYFKLSEDINSTIKGFLNTYYSKFERK